jgi:hypothetical protein
VVASAKDAAAFNTHSPGGGGSGLAQQVFRSPARIPASEAGRKGLCAAPASEKRYSLSIVKGQSQSKELPMMQNPD